MPRVVAHVTEVTELYFKAGNLRFTQSIRVAARTWRSDAIVVDSFSVQRPAVVVDARGRGWHLYR